MTTEATGEPPFVSTGATAAAEVDAEVSCCCCCCCCSMAAAAAARARSASATAEGELRGDGVRAANEASTGVPPLPRAPPMLLEARGDEWEAEGAGPMISGEQRGVEGAAALGSPSATAEAPASTPGLGGPGSTSATTAVVTGAGVSSAAATPSGAVVSTAGAGE